jgi:hypothetical protein
MNKKTWVIILIILVVLISGGTYLYFNIQKNLDLAHEFGIEGKKYATEVTTRISDSWDYQVLLNESTPELQEKFGTNGENAKNLLNTFKNQLGSLKNLSEFHGGSAISVDISGGKVPKGNYKAQAVFEKGDGDVIIDVIKRDKWMIRGFYITSSALK